MPLRSRTAAAEGRPSSSSGAASRVDKRIDFDKRKSRDDLYLMTSTLDNKQQQSFRSFHVPLRNRLPSPDISPTDRQPRNRDLVTVRTATPESLGELVDTSGNNIGMALGSPLHPPSAAAWQPPKWNPGSTTSIPSSTSSPAAQLEESSTKPKQRKWNLFRSKSKRNRAESSPFPNPEPTPAPPNSVAPSVPKSSARPSRGALMRSPSAAVSSSKHKPLVIRSQTEPLGPPQTTAPASHQKAPEPPSRAPPAIPVMEAQKQKPGPGQVAPKATAAHQPILNVDIPDITMERYSVMFGQVLKKRVSAASRHLQQDQVQTFQQSTTTNADNKPAEQPGGDRIRPRLPSDPTAPGLLARRNATLERLQVESNTSKLLAPPPKNTAASKSSPALYLFPPGVTKSGTPAPRSPRSRSNTSPALLPSPIRAEPEKQTGIKEAPRSQTFPMASHSPESRMRAGSVKHAKATLASRFQRQTPTPDSASSSATMEEKPSVIITEKLKPTIEEPEWEMVPPPVPLPDSMSASKKGSLSSVVSSEPSAVASPPEKTTEELAAEKALKEAVDKSITRQISVSREQRQLLGSFNAPSKRERKDKARKAAVGKISTGEHERLAETKTATPTIIHPEPQAESDLLRPGAVHVHRRSERIVLEGA